MKESMKRMAAMSVALVLLCVSAVAQNEKSTKNTTYSSSSVTITPGTYVELVPGQTAYLTITPKAGYYNVVIRYDDEPYQIGQPIVGNCFTATFSGTVNDGGTLTIRANNDAHKGDEGRLDVEAQYIPEDMWKTGGTRSRATITIKIKSSLGNKL